MRSARLLSVFYYFCRPHSALPTPYPTILHHTPPHPSLPIIPSCPMTSIPPTSPPTTPLTLTLRWSMVYGALGVAPTSFAEIPPACTLSSSWTSRCTWPRPSLPCPRRLISSRSCHFYHPPQHQVVRPPRMGAHDLSRGGTWGDAQGGPHLHFTIPRRTSLCVKLDRSVWRACPSLCGRSHLLCLTSAATATS